MESPLLLSDGTGLCNADCRREKPDHTWTADIQEKKELMLDEISRFSAAKQDKVMKNKEPDSWRLEIQAQIEQEIAQRVREALDTPPLERIHRNREKAKIRHLQHVQHANNRSYSVIAFEELKAEKAKKLAKKKHTTCHRIASTSMHTNEPNSEEEGNETGTRNTTNTFKHFQRNLSWINSITKTTSTFQNTKTHTLENTPNLKYTKKAFQALLSDQSEQALLLSKKGKTKEWITDENGVLLSIDGPFWPPDYAPVFPKPQHIMQVPRNEERLSGDVPQNGRTVHNQRSKWIRPWDGTLVVYDSERSSCINASLDVPEGCCNGLLFESRFESGNLRQAKRVGQFEYDLLLKTDLYTNRHTQWYYFRIQGMVPGVTYKFNIINLLKCDSLYNHGMRPLMYSEKKAQLKNIGWVRCGHHIAYSRNYSMTRNPLLHPDMLYYALEWQMEFEHEGDICYLAHCYPYTFTDLKEHIDSVVTDPDRGQYLKQEVMCETRARNSCFLLTISSFDDEDVGDVRKKGVVITARVHPGETNSSWIMKGIIDFLTSSKKEAQELRKNFVFKIVPMLNPDGVIVGNYRCSLAGRDLNRNYRNPRKESFPTIWHTKQMLEQFTRQREVLVYCDLHGHSRKHNVFIYGCDSKGTQSDAGHFLCLRLFPWLMSQKTPEKFTFRGCKFQVRKCKESTGRVVMWRQLGISNSFTLEATFCGSKNTSHVPRHFTLWDFEELGHQFGQVILQYHTAMINPSLHSELILEMTRDITHQVLEGRGVMPVQLINYCRQGLKSDTQEENDGSSRNRKTLDLQEQSKVEVKDLIQQITNETFEGCIGILHDLDAVHQFAESETSDSDSGSDSEVKHSQIKLDHTNAKSRNKKRSKNRAKSVPMLPELPRLGSTRQRKTNTPHLTSKSCQKPKYPAFVNRYIGRSNRGIPTYTGERIGERAAKRMESVINVSESDRNALNTAEEYDRLVSLTREIQIRTEEAPFKLSTRNEREVPLIGSSVFRQSYTHAGPGVLRGPPTLPHDVAKLSPSLLADNIESMKSQHLIVNQQRRIVHSLLSDPNNMTRNGPSELDEKFLLPNSFIGCSKGIRISPNHGSICICFQCQEFGKYDTGDMVTEKSSLYLSNNSDVRNSDIDLHGKMISQKDIQTSYWSNPTLLANGGVTVQGHKNQDTLYQQYGLFPNQSKPSKVYGTRKGVKSCDTQYNKEPSEDNSNHQFNNNV